VWGPYEKPMFAGDSLVAGGISGTGGLSMPWRYPLQNNVTQTFLTPSSCRYVDTGMPTTWAVNGYSGTLMDTWQTNAVAITTGKGYTIVFVAWGVNDASTGGSSITNVGTYLSNGCNAVWAIEPGIKFVVVGPMNNGEMWPQGANAADANIALVTANIKTACDTLSASGTITYLDPRTEWFPMIQIANPANTNGNFTLTVDNLHLNPTGAAQVATSCIWSHRVAA
jgi:GDSL-like Lipase/Acylhydrolase family